MYPSVIADGASIRVAGEGELSTPPVNSYLLPPSPVNKVTPPRSVADIVPITFWFSSIVNVEAEVNTGIRRFQRCCL